MKNVLVTCTIVLFCCPLLLGQTLRGTVYDAKTSEVLPFASVKVNGFKRVLTNDKGKFSVDIKKGKCNVVVEMVGYTKKELTFQLNADTSIVIPLDVFQNKLGTVVIYDPSTGEEKLEKTTMGEFELSKNEIKLIPTLGGEQDIIKVIQLLPGVNRGIEGSSDFFVRGGDADQNLLLLDGATMYNTGHLFGFVSVFNPDIIESSKFVKGAFPANYGGRLSSIIDIKSHNGIASGTEIDGSVGIISSRLTIKQPVIKDKLDIMVAGRRTYIDRVVAVVNSDVEIPYYFYDLNSRINYKLNKKNKFYLSYYFGDDVLDFQAPDENDDFTSQFDFITSSQSFGWQHKRSESLTYDLHFNRTNYNYEIANSFEDNSLNVQSSVLDYVGKFHINKYLENEDKISAGIDNIFHLIKPITIGGSGLFEDILPSDQSPALDFYEGSVFVHWDHKFDERWKSNFGYRQSMAITQGKFYTVFEPRIAARYKVNGVSSLKASYTRMGQYMHRISSSSVSLPTDMWFGVTKNITPQSADQFALGYVYAMKAHGMYLEVESYYKFMKNITEFSEGTNLLFNTAFEESLRQGKGRAYGIEFLLRRERKKLNGWLSYTLSYTDRTFEGINLGQTFPGKYDRRHNISLVLMYEFTKKIQFSAVWEYISGSRFTPYLGQYGTLNPTGTGLTIVDNYADRNSYGLASSHRLDFMIVVNGKERKHFNSNWHFGVYNTYNRTSPVVVSPMVNPNGSIQYIQYGLFGFLPSVAFNFNFK